MDHAISLEQATEMVNLYRSSTPLGMPLSESFQITSVNAVLSQSGCKALRIYYGMKPDATIHAILIGVNEKGEDMTEGLILEEGQRCPPECPPNSHFNQ